MDEKKWREQDKKRRQANDLITRFLNGEEWVDMNLTQEERDLIEGYYGIKIKWPKEKT
jgi:hypothetical protein